MERHEREEANKPLTPEEEQARDEMLSELLDSIAKNTEDLNTAQRIGLVVQKAAQTLLEDMTALDLELGQITIAASARGTRETDPAANALGQTYANPDVSPDPADPHQIALYGDAWLQFLTDQATRVAQTTGLEFSASGRPTPLGDTPTMN